MRPLKYLLLSSLAAVLAVSSGLAEEIPFLKKGSQLIIPPYFRFYDDDHGGFVFWSSDRREGKFKHYGSYCHTTLTSELANSLYQSKLAAHSPGRDGFFRILGHYSLLQPLEFELYQDVPQPNGDKIQIVFTRDGKPPVNNEKVILDCELGPTGYRNKIELKNVIYNLEFNFKLNVN